MIDIEHFREPAFSQRELVQISGVDSKAIDNWIERGVIKLTEHKKRHLKGRRLFSRIDILQVTIIGQMVRNLRMPPSSAPRLPLAEEILNTVWVDMVDGLKRGADGHIRVPSPLPVYHLCYAEPQAAAPPAEGPRWFLRQLRLNAATGGFQSRSGEPFTKFPPHAFAIIPTQAIALYIIRETNKISYDGNGELRTLPPAERS